jgi:hypothetical protein
MFGKSFKAKFKSAKLGVRHTKKQSQKTCELELCYDFDETIAAAIGGDAPPLQAMLANSSDRSCATKSTTVQLDATDVGIRFRLGNQQHAIESTFELSASAKKPNAEDPGPTLTVKAGFFPDDADLAMVWERLNSVVGTRMDRRQLTLPKTGGEDEATEEDAE